MLKKSTILPQIREQCERGIRYTYALKNIMIGGIRRKISPQTIENWRDARPSISRYIDYCVNIRDEKITDAVEDKLTDRILKGEASPAEIIFYLCNRRQNRWKRYDPVQSEIPPQTINVFVQNILTKAGLNGQPEINPSNSEIKNRLN